MAKPIKRAYSLYATEALQLLAKLIRAERIQRNLSLQEVADRAGISRGLLQRIEKGNGKCEIGAVFEVAAIVGVKLFESSEKEIKEKLQLATNKLSLLPKAVRKIKKEIDDEF